MEVNCLLKRFAIDCCLVKVLVPNLMGWLGGGFEFFSDSLFMRRQYFLMSDLWEVVDSSFLYASLASLLVSLVIWAFSVEIVGSEGLVWHRASHWLFRLRMVGEKLGLQVFLWPVGMVRFVVFLIIF